MRVTWNYISVIMPGYKSVCMSQRVAATCSDGNLPRLVANLRFGETYAWRSRTFDGSPQMAAVAFRLSRLGAAWA